MQIPETVSALQEGIAENCCDPVYPPEIKISEIIVDPRRRKLNSDKVKELAESISQVGLLQPVVINEDNRLLAGWHRLEACKVLKWEAVPCRRLVGLSALDTELAEIDENLIRNELTVLERAEHLKRRKEIYEEKYPDAKAGVRRAYGMNKALGYDVGEIVSPTFAEDTAAKLGVSPRTVQQEIQIAEKITPNVKEIVADTELADSKKDLLKLARMEPEIQKKVAEKIVKKEAKNVREAVRALKHEPKKSGEMPDGKFDVILADPPWKYEFAESEARAIENQYPTMTLEEIMSLSIPSAESAVLLLWTTAPKLEESLEVMKAWGFKYRTCAVWDKEVKGMGYWFRIQHELLLLGVKGDFPPPESKSRFDSVIRSQREKHSKKPEVVYEMIEKMFPGHRYLELFARNTRPGWTSWGNEV